MVRHVKTKRGEVPVLEVRYTKAEFQNLEVTQRKHYFVLAQIANEMAMLRVLIIQALNGAKGPKPVLESGLGLAFMLARILAGRLHEGWHEHVGKDWFSKEFEVMATANGPDFVQEVNSDISEARERLSNFFSNPNNVATLTRKKLAFHNDQAALSKAFDLLPDDFDLVDFHTGKRGTTFYGSADSLTAIAVSGLMNYTDLAKGQQELASEVAGLAGDLETLIDGYLVAFVVRHFGVERFNKPSTIITGRPQTATSKIHFLLDDKGIARRLAAGISET